MDDDSPQPPMSALSQLSMRQKIDFVTGLLYYPALTLQIFIRKKSGFRQLKPVRLLVLTMLMIVFAYFVGGLAERSTGGFFGQSVITPTAAPQAANIPPGFDAPLPANWNSITIGQRRAWMQQHQLTPQQQQERQKREQAERERLQAEAQAKAESEARWAKFRAFLNRWPLIVFALAFLAWGLIQRRQRWYDLRRGVLWHTRTRGISYFVPVLGSVMREANIMRFADPLACLIAGLVLFYFSRGLGAWVTFSALAFYIVEQNVYEKELERALDQHDSQCYSIVMSEIAEHFSGKPQEHQAQPVEQTAGIPTGIAPDLEAQIAERRAKQKLRHAQGPDVEPVAQEYAVPDELQQAMQAAAGASDVLPPGPVL